MPSSADMFQAYDAGKLRGAQAMYDRVVAAVKAQKVGANAFDRDTDIAHDRAIEDVLAAIEGLDPSRPAP